jgi:hypothetical protein
MLRRQYPELEFLESAYSSMMELMDTGEILNKTSKSTIANDNHSRQR